MTTNKPNPAQLTKEEKEQASDVIKRRFFEKLGLDPNLSERKIRFGSTSNLSAEDEQTMAMAKGLQIAMEYGMDQVLAQIQTQEDLQGALRAVEEVADRGPTIARDVMDQIRAQLRRRGGPGRSPLLNDQEALIVRDQILKFVRNGSSETEAIFETSKLCPELLGKKVGPRTLKTKVWDRRNELSKIDKQQLK